MTTVDRNAPSIVRHVVVSDCGLGPRISDCFRTRDEAVLQARKEKEFFQKSPYRGPKQIKVRRWNLRPNSKIQAFGVDRFDKMLTDVSTNGFTVTGSLEDLIDCGVIGSYIRNILGKSGCKSSCDEYGNS